MDTKTDTKLSLKPIPRDECYEDFVAAQLNAGGYYLERNVVLRDKTEVLELDIVSNKFYEADVDKSLIEVKSGGWGFPEIFKVKGWMDFLGLPKASFIVQKENGSMDKYREVSDQLNVSLIVTPEHEGKLDESEICKVYDIKKHEKNGEIVASLRFAFALERRMIKVLHDTAKSVHDKKGYAVLKDYLFEINSNSFFIADSKARAQSIFNAYADHKNITAKIDHERNGENYDDISDDVSITYDTFRHLFYECDASSILYSSLYVEWLQRMSMLKCCVEEIQKPIESKLFDFTKLPDKLEERMKELESHTYYYLYPYFWQVFIFLFGGFILNDKKDDEYQLLSEITNIPVEEIPNAFSALDTLFPFGDDKKWLYDIQNASMSVLQLFPIPLCGIGANFRRLIYAKDKVYPDLKNVLTGKYTYENLIKWNQLGYKMLQKSNDIEQVIANNESDKKTP